MNESNVRKQESIGQHYSFLLANEPSLSVQTLLDAFTACEYSRNNQKWEQGYPHWKKLIDYCSQWILEHQDGPYVVGKTDADVMDWAMKRLARDPGPEGRPLKAPGAWLPVIKRLRAWAKANTPHSGT